MADGIVNIDSERARNWSERVNAEIARTSKTLEEVYEACNEYPGENDAIIGMIERTGRVLQNTYEETIRGFKNAWEEISRGIAEFSKVGDKIGDGFDELIGKIRR